VGTNYNPKIVTDGLVVCLDAANPKSYPGSGTTWNDLSENGNILSASGTVNHSTLESGYFTFPGTSGNYYGVNTVNFSSTTFDRTIICWFWPDSTGPADNYTGLVKIGNSASTTPSDSILLCINTISSTWGVASAYWSNDYNPGGSALPVIKDSWNMAAIIAKSSPITNNTTLICGNNNGFNTLTGTSSNYTRGVEHTNTLFRIGCTDTGGGRPMKGKISKVELYNRALTVAEIQQNFNATRGRYGI
jgi:hypothetical protein